MLSLCAIGLLFLDNRTPLRRRFRSPRFGILQKTPGKNRVPQGSPTESVSSHAPFTDNPISHLTHLFAHGYSHFDNHDAARTVNEGGIHDPLPKHELNQINLLLRKILQLRGVFVTRDKVSEDHVHTYLKERVYGRYFDMFPKTFREIYDYFEADYPKDMMQRLGIEPGTLLLFFSK